MAQGFRIFSLRMIVYLFSKADVRSVRKIKEVIKCYERFSGQKVNYDKSSMYFSANIRHDVTENLRQILGVQMARTNGKYLGLPYLIGRSRKKIFSFIKERTYRRLKSWKERTLSQAGRQVLIKAIVQATPTYVMSCFLLPEGLCKEITGIVRQF